MAGGRYAVVDATGLTEGEHVAGMAANYVRWEVGRLGGQIVEPADADMLLVTAVSAGEWRTVPRAIKRSGLDPDRRKRSKPVVVGGQVAMCPSVLDPYADVLCVGEGRNFLTVLVRDGLDAAKAMPNAWVPDETREVVPDEDFPFDMPPVYCPDNYVRVFGSRGCPHKCAFCQTGWQASYRENNEARVVRQLAGIRARGNKPNVVTNDLAALSFVGGLGRIDHASLSYDYLSRLCEHGIPAGIRRMKLVRLGVEGVSERLRRLVSKPIPTEGLYRLTVGLLNVGVFVRWFVIAGLPGEHDQDYDELRGVASSIRHDARKGQLQLDFTAFCPQPATPLGLAALSDDYWRRFDGFCDDVLGGALSTHRLYVIKCQQPKGRMAHAVGSMGCTEADIRRGWLDRDPPNWRIRYPHRHLLRRAYNSYARRAGLPLSTKEDGYGV